MECSDLSELWISFGLSAFRATSIPSNPSQPFTRDTSGATFGFASHSVPDVANYTAPPPQPAISPNGTTCALTLNVLTRDVPARDAQSRGPPHR
jgi:hypothetical protein